MTTLRGNWNYPTLIRFGAGRISELADGCKSLGITRPLLVTDPGLAKLPMIAAAVDSCRAAGLKCEVFSEVQTNPVEANVTAGVLALPWPDSDRPDDVLALAEAALLRAKAQGGERIGTL